MNEFCSRTKADGTTCPNARMPGMDVCWTHGTWQQRNWLKRGKAKIELVRVTQLAGRLDVSPAVVMLDMVQEAASNVEFYGQLVSALRAETDDMGAGGAAPLVIDSEGVQGLHSAWVGAGVAARTDPDNWKAEPHVLVRMYDAERDRLMRYAKLCLDAGVAERLVKLAEQQGRAMVKVLDAAFERLELSPAQVALLPAIMGEILGQVPDALPVDESEQT